jgi:integrase
VKAFPYDVWHRAVRLAGPTRRIPHDFRRTAARNYRRAGVTEGVVMMVGGWKTRSIFERYNIKSEHDLREAAELVTKSAGTSITRDRALVVPLPAPQQRR